MSAKERKRTRKKENQTKFAHSPTKLRFIPAMFLIQLFTEQRKLYQI